MQVLETKPPTEKTSYRPDIDGLRALAVVAVIINHLNKDLLPSGYLGVDIFFVISGFVITSSLFNRPSKGFRDFLTGFYTRRIKRLVPALVVCVVITGLLICLFNPDPSVSLKTGIASLFGLSNLFLYKESTDYFATSTELNVFTHTWSLGVEEQFYFLFPFLVWFTGFSRLTAKGARNLFWVTSSLAIASLVAFVSWYPTNPSAAYFLMPTRLWEMGAGCLLFLSLQSSSRFIGLVKRLPALAITLSMIGVLFLPLQFAVQATIAMILLTSIWIATLRPNTLVYRLFTHPQVVYIGLISYSLYLWHWSVLSLSRWTIGIHWWSVPFQIALIVGLSLISYRYIETPLRRCQWSALRWRTIAYGLMVSFSAAGILTILDRPLHGKLYSGILYKGLTPVVPKTNNPQMNNYVVTHFGPQAAACHSSDVKENDILKGEKQLPPSFMKDCLRQQSGSQQLYAFIGDSHMLSLFPLADKLTFQEKINTFTHTRDGCAFPSQGPTTRNGCDEIMTDTKAVVLDLFTQNPGSVLVTASYLTSHFGYQGSHSKQFINHPSGSRKDVEQNFQDYLAKLTSLASFLAQAGGSLVVVAPLPQHPNLYPDICMPQWFRPNFSIPPHCTYTDAEFLRQKRKPIVEALKKLEQENPNVFVYDPFDLICQSTENCYSSHQGKPLYFDSNHLNAYGAQFIYQDFRDFLHRHHLLKTASAVHRDREKLGG